MTLLEYRDDAALGQIVDVNPGDHTFSLRIVNYSGGPMRRADSYGSVWEPGVFSDSLRANPRPAAAYAHNWERIIGSLKEHTERAEGLDGLVQFANMDEVPDAKMAWSLIRDGHLRDTSFGFKRQPGGWSDTRAAASKIEGEKERMTRARLDEVSPVLVGAVPGAGVLAVRSADGSGILKVTAAELLTKLAAKTITLRDALEALETRNGELEDRAAVDPHAFVDADGDGDCDTCGQPEEASVHTKADVPTQRAMTRAEMEDAWAGMYVDGLSTRAELRVVTSLSGAQGEAKLKEYWAHGKGAAKIAWGTPRDHTRCVAELSKYVGPNVVHGLCTNIQKLAIGHAGNPTAAERGEAREPETEPSPT